jgi:hypothetical protein
MGGVAALFEHLGFDCIDMWVCLGHTYVRSQTPEHISWYPQMTTANTLGKDTCLFSVITAQMLISLSELPSFFLQDFSRSVGDCGVLQVLCPYLSLKKTVSRFQSLLSPHFY